MTEHKKRKDTDNLQLLISAGFACLMIGAFYTIATSDYNKKDQGYHSRHSTKEESLQDKIENSCFAIGYLKDQIKDIQDKYHRKSQKVEDLSSEIFKSYKSKVSDSYTDLVHFYTSKRYDFKSLVAEDIAKNNDDTDIDINQYQEKYACPAFFNKSESEDEKSSDNVKYSHHELYSDSRFYLPSLFTNIEEEIPYPND